LNSEPKYFLTAIAFRDWFAQHASSETELIVGFMKRRTGAASITWPEAVDEALCVGWIDGVRTRIDDERYKIRFTPRKSSSHWSAVNIERAAALIAEGRMQAAGLAAFARRTEARSRRASYEQPEMPELDSVELARLRDDQAAWAYFQTLPPSYLKREIWRVVSAKKIETRKSRMDAFLLACADGRRL
jgi:uncharacterized protein YdeI (YjbR/CyaY-like superfamily)